MIDKELREVKRHLHPEKSNISSVRGCFVNEQGEIVTEFNQSLSITPNEESAAILNVVRKTLSGSLNTNLLNIEFSTEQVKHSEEHALLMALKQTELKDDAVIRNFYNRVIESVKLEGNYLILLACDSYDVFSYTKDGMREQDSTDMYSFIICSICPIKPTKSALSFHPFDNSFHALTEESILSAPALGFLFPAFDDRTENIYNALYYTHDTSQSYPEFAERIFNVPLPMPADVQKETFGTCLKETIAEDCDFEMMKKMQTQVAEMIDDHKEQKVAEPLTLSKSAFQYILKSGGVDEERVKAFSEKFDEEFGENAEVKPQNVIETKKLEVTLPDISIKVAPEKKDLITTKVIDGTKYILIRASETVEVNGVSINIEE